MEYASQNIPSCGLRGRRQEHGETDTDRQFQERDENWADGCVDLEGSWLAFAVRRQLRWPGGIIRNDSAHYFGSVVESGEARAPDAYFR
jgi:hypothetical protein